MPLRSENYFVLLLFKVFSCLKWKWKKSKEKGTSHVKLFYLYNIFLKETIFYGEYLLIYFRLYSFYVLKCKTIFMNVKKNKFYRTEIKGTIIKNKL